MRGRFAGADDPAGLLSRRGVRLRPGMDDKQDHRPDQAQGLPPSFTGVRVGPADREGIIEDKPRRFETQAMIPLVGPVLLLLPRPTHASPIL